MNMTETLGRVVLALAFVVMLVAAARAALADAVIITPQTAIEQALVRRLGTEVAIDVEKVATKVAAEPSLVAVPEPGGRAGEPMRFTLTAAGVRRGTALATVRVHGTYARAAQPIARDEVVSAAAVETVEGELPRLALRRWPAVEEVIGLTARRNIARGEPLTQAVLQVPPLVRAGDLVAVTATVGVVQVSGTATAGGSGQGGDVIRVLPKPAGRPVKARITGRGTVEVVQ